MECKLQTTNAKMMCVPVLFSVFKYVFLTLFATQVTSMSYHAASGNMVIALTDGAIQVWQTDPHIATSLQRSLPDHVCVRERLAAAQAQANEIQATIEKADDGLRQQLAREKELRQSIADLEAKCTHIFTCNYTTNMYVYSGEREESTGGTANCRVT